MNRQNTVTIKTSSEEQFSGFLLDHLKPLTMRRDWSVSHKINYYIKPFIQTNQLILDLGEAEHTSDWDPSIIIQLWDQNGELQTIETDPGYYVMDIQDTVLLLEDSPGNGEQEDEDISYHIIPIQSIHSIQLIRS